MTIGWLRTWQLGIKSLLLYPLRSFLTVLGVLIGVASVIGSLAFVEGISQKAQALIENLGATNIIVRTEKPPAEGFTGSIRFHEYGVKRRDYDQLVATLPTIERAIRIREIPRKFSYGRHISYGRLVGCTPEYAEVTHQKIDRGHFITDVDLHNKENVCVLASGIAEKLFPLENPIGKKIHVEEDYYNVVGVMHYRTPSAGIGGSLTAQNFDSDVYIPIETLWARIGDTVELKIGGSWTGEIVELSQITFRVDSIENVEPTADAIRGTIERNHPIKDYEVVVPLELLEKAKTTRMMYMLLGGAFAAISLGVGGIGIMNIMLATVTERTREIGIRRALGAKRRDITLQFLVETIVLSTVGGATGILGGFAGCWFFDGVRELFTKYAPDLVNSLPEEIRTVSPQIVPWSIPLAFGISVAVGIIFGLYPAIRAAKMDPIEALRHE